MNIDRRQLVLPALAIGLVGVVLGAVPAFAGSADEDAVAKSVEAFRAAQVATDGKAFEALCAAELSYGHSDARVEDKATFIANATNRKTRFLSLAYQDIKIRVVGPAAIVRFNWVSESEAIADVPAGARREQASRYPALVESLLHVGGLVLRGKVARCGIGRGIGHASSLRSGRPSVFPGRVALRRMGTGRPLRDNR
jgi:hypothetical protein